MTLSARARRCGGTNLTSTSRTSAWSGPTRSAWIYAGRTLRGFGSWTCQPGVHDDFGASGALLVAPGDPARSILYRRITRRGEGQMPPTSSNRVDTAGTQLIERWISSLAK